MSRLRPGLRRGSSSPRSRVDETLLL